MHAAIYLRQSLDRTGDGVAIARQREDCVRLCREKGWTPLEYVDNDTSASSGKTRKGYQRMLSDLRDDQRGIGAVVCWDLDRLHRRPVELESFMALADERRLALATVSGDVDLSTAQGRLIARLKGSVAAHEIEHKSARQRRAAKQKAEQGSRSGPTRSGICQSSATRSTPANRIRWSRRWCARRTGPCWPVRASMTCAGCGTRPGR